MITLLKVINESIAQALQQLRGNKLRSFLSLLGISIGIFCIIGVLSAVDSLEDNVRGSFDKLGNDVIYVRKWPWADVSGDWWKYIRRPNPDHDDFEAVSDRAALAEAVSFHVVVGFRTLKYKSNSVEGAVLIAASMGVGDMFSLEFEKGRYFSPSEYRYGSNKIVLGATVAEELFGNLEPIGKDVKLQGRNYEVIGVIEKSGEALINVMDFDNTIIVSYPNARGLANLRASQVFEASINIQAAKGIQINELKDEVRGILRAHRRLKPKAEDDFSLNELSMLDSILDNFFNVLNLLGVIIGLFALIVGGFSVANIMFVSVKERTSIIGIKKALGAKRYIILLEFLIEAIILCLIGGAIGLLLVHLVTTILTRVINFELYLDFGNISIGILCSVLIGIISGIIPAVQGARMDPVEAMRH